MTKTDKVDELFDIAMRRYATEKPDVVVTQTMRDAIWFSIHGEFSRRGEYAAKKFVETANLQD